MSDPFFNYRAYADQNEPAPTPSLYDNNPEGNHRYSMGTTEGIMKSYDPNEFQRLKAMADAGVQFPVGSPEYMKMTMWANHDAWKSRQNDPSIMAPPPEAPPTPTTAAPAVMPPTTAPTTAPTPQPASALETAATMPAPPQQQSSAMSTGTDVMTPQNQKHSIDININKPEEEIMLQQPQQQPINGGILNNMMAGQMTQWQPQTAAPAVMPPAPYPQPSPSVPPQGQWTPFTGPSPVPPATPPPPSAVGGGSVGPVMPPPPAAGPAIPQGGGQFGAPTFAEDNMYGPQQIAGTRPDAADYGSVRDFSDAALGQARRYLDPQQDMQNRRLDQELINKGIDPNSAQGREMANMLSMQQADANNAAAFGAMGFGQGVQNQMAQQAFQRSGLAGDMQKALWNAQLGSSGQNLQKYLGDQSAANAAAQMQNQYNLGMAGLDTQRYGMDLQQQLGRGSQDLQRMGLQNQYNLGVSGQDLQRYGMDLQNQLGMGHLDMQRQGQDFNQMMGLEGLSFRDRQYGDQQQMYQDQLMLSLLGQNPYGQGNMIDPTGMAGNQMVNSGNAKGIAGTVWG